MHQYHHQGDIHPVPSTLYRKKHDGKLLKYDVLQEIGKGGFGVVYSAIESPSKKKVALKCTPKWRLNKPKIKQKLINEMTIHRSLDHPNIVNFLGTFHDEYYIYFILELCEGGNVFEYIKNFNSKQNEKPLKNIGKMPSNNSLYTFNNQSNLQCLPEFEVIKITKQILKALDYLHSTANVIHRDIKLQNFLLTKDGIVKLSDFGLSIKFEDVSDKASMISICGTPNYISPEVIDRDSHTSAVDIWGVGVIVFLMLTGQRPFKSVNNKKTFERIRQVHYDWPTWPIVSELAKSFVDSILKKNPLDRPTARKLLRHPFLCTDDKTNKKSNSADSSIKFPIPKTNSSRISTSTYTSGSTSNAASNRSSSNQSTPSSLNSQKNAHHQPEKMQYRSLSPSRFPINTQIHDKKKSIPNNSPSSPSNLINNLTSTSHRSQNRSFSPIRSTIYSNKNDIQSSHRSNYISRNLSSMQSPYLRSRGMVLSKPISHILLTDDYFTDIKDEIKFYDKNQKPPKTAVETNDDFKLDQSSTLIIKATVETIEDAAKQAELARKTQNSNQNITKQKEKPISSEMSPIKGNKTKKVEENPVIQSNQNKEDYHIDFGIVPSSNSKAFPQSSVLLWWDYSSKYGLGYILYNGCVGVCFNDSSRIIMEPTERLAQFYSKPNAKMEIIKIDDYESENDQPETNSNENNENDSNGQRSIENDSSLSLPNKKKILILKHFAKNLKKMALKHIDPSLINPQENIDLLVERFKSKQLDYIKYWGTNKKDGILFKMNGKSLQASFTDKTSLYVCADSKNVIYDDSKTIHTVPLRDLLSNKKSNPIQSKFLIAKDLGKNLE